MLFVRNLVKNNVPTIFQGILQEHFVDRIIRTYKYEFYRQNVIKDEF